MLTLAGIPCGIITGFTGISNTYLSASLLHWLIGLRDRKLNGTVLIIAGFTALTAILAYGQHHLVLVAQAIVCGAGFLGGAAYGTRVETSAPTRRVGAHAGTVLLLATGLLMVSTGLNFVHPGRGLLGHWFGGNIGLVSFLALGALLGFLGRVTEVWGLLIVPSLVYVVGLSIFYAQGAALFILLLSTIPLGLVFAQASETEPRASIWMSFGGLFGALAGSQLATGGLTPNLLMFVHGIALLLLGMARLTQKPSAQSSSGGGK